MLRHRGQRRCPATPATVFPGPCNLRNSNRLRRVDLDEAISIAAANPGRDLLDLDDALTRLEAVDPVAAALVKLRY